MTRHSIARQNAPVHCAADGVILRLVFWLGTLLASSADDGLAAGTLPDRQTTPIQVVDPSDPGPDRPLVGRSAFDTLFAVDRDDGHRHEVPFPFSKLLARIDRDLPRNASGDSTLRKVLIPLGRSLQRHAAAPAYFKSPRVVVAVDSEPVAWSVKGRPYLKDRLFLGYQAAANIVEVISYNERAGRFEFQIVTDYASGRRPRVRYANRGLCMSCHQNGGPIFPTVNWSETNLNPSIAERLLAEAEAFHGVQAHARHALPALFDTATNRANLFSLYQLLWQQGCRAARRDHSIRCRAGALTAMLRHRLGAFSVIDADNSLVREYFLPILEHNRQQSWPDGLLLPNPNIPDRRPFSMPTPDAVPAAFDPLRPRSALATWSPRNSLDIRRAVAGLADFLPEADIRRLDEHLFREARQRATPLRKWAGPCSFGAADTAGNGKLVEAECRLRRRGDSRQIYLVGDLLVNNGVVDGRELNGLTLIDGNQLTELRHQGGVIHLGPNEWRVELSLFEGKTGRHARLLNGWAVDNLTIRWSGNGHDKHHPRVPSPKHMGSVMLMIRNDFEPVHIAIAKLIRAHWTADSNVLDEMPLQGARIMNELFRTLGLSGTESCCPQAVTMPPPVLDEDVQDTPTGNGRNESSTDRALIFGDMVYLSKNIRQDLAPQYAETYVQSLDTIQSMYSSNVVARVKPRGVRVRPDYSEHEGAIAKPARPRTPAHTAD
jgi:hypothetical protein